MPIPKRKIWDKVLLPRKSDFNIRHDRDIRTTIADVRIWKVVSYLCVNWYKWIYYSKQRILEPLLRDLWWNVMFKK